MAKKTGKTQKDKFNPRSYSRSATQTTFNRLKRYFGSNRWIGSTNRYAVNCIDKIKNDCKPPRNIAANHLAEYIAASAPLHCLDGWSFLGKAIISHALGDTDASKHFAYYAQLRAVMSLMASEGVGIFDRKHFGVKSATRQSSTLTAPKTSSTHEFAETQFRSWANSNRSGDLLKNIIRPRGSSLEEWFNEISPGTKTAVHAQSWLDHWGYDLKKFRKDHDARNRASYRPTALGRDLTYRNSTNIAESLELVDSIWRMCMPDRSGGFTLDLHLLRASWDEHSRNIGRQPTRAGRETILNHFGILQPELNTLLDFFDRKTFSQDSIILTEARKKGSPEDYDYHKQMLCRATLLLRLATGASNQMITEAKISKTDLKFWWEAVGENFGLWESGLADPITDMWTEVETALQNMQTPSSPVGSHYHWRFNSAEEVLTLAGCERIALSQFCI